MMKKKGIVIGLVLVVLLSVASFVAVRVAQEQTTGMRVVEGTGEEGSKNPAFEM